MDHDPVLADPNRVEESSRGVGAHRHGRREKAHFESNQRKVLGKDRRKARIPGRRFGRPRDEEGKGRDRLHVPDAPGKVGASKQRHEDAPP
jgi:hypothetical protein